MSVNSRVSSKRAHSSVKIICDAKKCIFRVRGGFVCIYCTNPLVTEESNIQLPVLLDIIHDCYCGPVRMVHKPVADEPYLICEQIATRYCPPT